MPALALTDLSNVFGLVKFYQATRGEGIKPIIGCDAWISNEADRDKPRASCCFASPTPVIYCCAGFCRVHTVKTSTGGGAEIKKSWFSEDGTVGLDRTIERELGDVGLALMQNDSVQAESLAKEWAGLFPGRFYIEFSAQDILIRRFSCSVPWRWHRPCACRWWRHIPYSF